MNKHEDHENRVKIIKIMCVEGGGFGGGGVFGCHDEDTKMMILAVNKNK